MAKFNNIIKWIFLIGFSTTLVIASDDDKSIVEKVNKTLGKIEEDFINLAIKISSTTTDNPVTITTGKTTPKTPPTTSNNPATITTGKTTPKTPPTTSNNPATITTGKTTPKTQPTTSNNPATITTGKTTPKTPPTTSNNPATITTGKTTPKTEKPATTSNKPASTVKSEDELEAYPHVVRKKRDVLSQIWQMKMRKMRNKLVTIPTPADVQKLKDAMAAVTTVTTDIAAATIKEEQVTTVDAAEKTIHDIVDKADSTLLNYLKSNPKILESLQKQADAASDTVEKYYKDNFEDDGGSNVGAIVGGVCGGVAGVGLLGFGYYYYKKRQS